MVSVRNVRAQIVTANVMHALHPIFERVEILESERSRDLRRDAANAIMDVLFAIGVEVITDADRARAGLNPRNEYGLTDVEMLVLEDKRLAALTAPIVFPAQG